MSSSDNSPASSRRATGNRRNRNNRAGSKKVSSKTISASNSTLDNTSIRERLSSADTLGSHHDRSQISTDRTNSKISDLESELRDRSEQILKLRKENRSLLSRIEEVTDNFNIEKQTHEKILSDLNQRHKRSLESAQRDVSGDLGEAQDQILNLQEQNSMYKKQLENIRLENKKYKEEAEKTTERLTVTSAQLVDMSAQYQKLTESAMAREKEKGMNLESQRQENVQSEEVIQNYQRQIHELQLELEHAKNDTRLVNLQLSTNEEKYSSKENLTTQTIASLTTERDGLKTANSALSQQIDDLKQHLGNHSTLNFEIEALQNELNRYKKLFEDNSAVVDKLRQSESDLQVQLATKSTELNSMLSQSTASTETQNQLKQQTSILNEQLQSKNSEIASLNTKISSYQSQNSELQTRITTLETQNLEIPRLEQNIKMLESSTQDISKIQSLIAEKDTVITRVETELNASKNESNTLQEQITGLKTDVALKQQAFDKLQGVNNELQASIAQSTALIDSKSQRVAQLEQSEQDARNQTGKLYDENMELQKQISSKNGIIGNIEEQISKIKEENKMILQKSISTNAELESAKERLRDIESRSGSQSEQNKQLENSLQITRDDLKNSKLSLASLEEEKKMFETSLTEIKTRLEAREAELKKYEETAEKSRLQVEKMYSDSMTSQNKIAEQEAKIASLSQELSNTESEKSRYKNDTERLNTQIEDLSKKIETLLPLQTALSNANNEAKSLSDQLEIKAHS